MTMPEATMVRMLRMLKRMLNLGTCRARTCLVGGVGLCIPHGPGLGCAGLKQPVAARPGPS